VDPLFGDEVAGRAFVVQRGVDGSVGPRSSDVCEDAFRAAALVEIVVDER
jgi:hypothetical protein